MTRKIVACFVWGEERALDGSMPDLQKACAA